MRIKQLIVVVGPTGSGKTDLSIRLARHYGAPILSTDSRQFYRGLAIGTAQPTAAQLQAAEHHFIASHAVDDDINCGSYEVQALACLARLYARHDRGIAAGSSGYDFAIRGNAIDTSNEPGIVWVMTDRNGNGRPDDTWYELRGSETGKTTTFADYEVTYYRPDAPQSDVRWTDNRGGEGRIEYLPHHHRQDSYYPAWIEADRYTLKGTRLEAHNRYDEGKKQWVNYPYDWGYVDNAGSDLIDGIAVGFRIANAIDASGAPVRLESIDFIRVQTGVNFQSAGNIGEVSTEVCGFEDLTRH